MTENIFLKQALGHAVNMAKEKNNQFVCPEHLLSGLIMQSPFYNALTDVEIDADALSGKLDSLIDAMEIVPDDIEYDIEASAHLNIIMNDAFKMAVDAASGEITVPLVIKAMLNLEDCIAGQLIAQELQCSEADFLSVVIDAYMDAEGAIEDMQSNAEPQWRRYITDMKALSDTRPPLIGRQEEMDRAILVLCRREKNNVLFVGEPGVGKTALAWGLVARIIEGNVPDRLKSMNVYQLDMGLLMAGTQMRGELEKRLRMVFDGIVDEGPSMVFIDELQSLVGSSSGDDGSSDAIQLLSPYMDSDTTRIVTCCNYQEQNKYASRIKRLMRRLQLIDVPEPSRADAIQILEGLRSHYETYHGVHFEDGVIEYAVDLSMRHITERCLPDKAIDVLDEAGALCETLTGDARTNVSRTTVNTVVQKIARIKAEALCEDGVGNVASLKQRITSCIYGQDDAVDAVVRSIELAKAGLTDEDKPMASLLFVGPTGVGKTEVARVLASELGIELVRFDMSEYTEKHTVAKLIGSPAGYVGYEDGGLLTDAIRKTPNCVLLLDEIEKAHSDIYNILLQVMDYARLTDNKGQHADFRHVILIMTSNAGAQHATQATVGFASQETTGTAMLTAVKKTFKPEFIGRLSATVVFGDMTHEMARRILTKKLNQLSVRLAAKNVVMHVSDEALDLLLAKGFTRKNGARELDRTINSMLTPLLTREILFGRLKNGGDVTVVASEGNCKLI